MKHAEVQKLHEAGLITDEQRQSIVAHFGLTEDANRFLVIISFVGAGLVAAGIALLIASNWDAILRDVKLAAGLGLMLGAHGLGWWLREVRQDYRKTGEALHLAGSLLFLANLALVGQIYHLVSRPPNAILLWWAGIAALPWLLLSKAQHLLALLALGIWFGFEVNQEDSLVRLRDQYQVLAYSLMGLVYVGFGYVLRRSTFASFAKVTERLGLVAFLIFAYPLTWQGFLGDSNQAVTGSYWILPVLAVLAATLVALGVQTLELDRQWRWTWVLALVIAAGLLVAALFAPHERVLGLASKPHAAERVRRTGAVCLRSAANPGRLAGALGFSGASRGRVCRAGYHRGVHRLVRNDGADRADVRRLRRVPDCVWRLSRKETAQVHEANQIAARTIAS